MKSTSAVFLEEAGLLGPKSFSHVGRGSLSFSPQLPPHRPPPPALRSAVVASVEGEALGWVPSWGAFGLEDVSAAQRQWRLGAEAPKDSERQGVHITSVFSNRLSSKPHFSGSNTSSSSTYTRLHLGTDVRGWTVPSLWPL